MEEKYPEDIVEFVEEILKELNLFRQHKEGNLELRKIEDPKKRLEISENLPGAKLARIIRRLVIGEISQKNLDLHLKETFNISREKAKEIAGKIIKKLFPEREVGKKEEISERIVKREEEKVEKKVEDIYREPIE